MEMWRLGSVAEPWRLALFLGLSLPALVLLSRYSGFEPTGSLIEDVADAFAAMAIGAVTATGLVWLLAATSPLDGLFGVNGRIAIQTVPAAIGALVARKQLGGSGEDENGEEREKRAVGYWGTLFLMAMGALYLSFNIVPTEEAVLIGYRMSPWQGIVLIVLSLAVLHAFVYGLGFSGQKEPEKESPLALFASYTLAGYAVSILTLAYVLWTFGQLEGMTMNTLVMPLAVMGFPAALGAATTRLII